MKLDYKGFEIEIDKRKSVAGDELLYYSAFRISDQFELDSGYSETGIVNEWIENLKNMVDDYLENPEQYEDDL
jgi:hypothetical protein